MNQGAEIVELDIRQTKDLVLVMSHADLLSLLHGVKISQLTYAELEARGYQPEKLADTLKAIPPHVRLDLDLKDTYLDLALADLLKKNDDEKRIIFDSNNVPLLHRYQHHFPKAAQMLNTGSLRDPLNMSSTFAGRLILFFLPILFNFPYKFLFRRKVRRSLPEFISFYSGFCKLADVNFYHSIGVKVFVYTVNKEQNMRKFIAMGVDGIKTDKPALLKKVCDQVS